MNRRAVDADARPGVDNKFSQHRRAPRAMIATMLMLVVAALTVMTVVAPTPHATAIEAPDDVVATNPTPPTNPTDTQPSSTEPPIATNEFIPEDENLTTCIGVLERPGCGSKSRGGWRQNLVFGVMFVGLIVVFGNVARGVSKGRRNQG